MPAKIINVTRSDDPAGAIREAADALDDGGLVVFPTETVYGVAARVDRPDALNRLYVAKNRPTDQPFTVHLGRREDADAYVTNPGRTTRQLMKKAWPGPLTLLVNVDDPASTPIAKQVGSTCVDHIFREGVVGLRFPDNLTAANLFAQAGGPVVAASANLAGKQPPRTVEDALKDLDGDVTIALDDGPATYNTPSTIARVSGDSFEIVRQGVYDERMLSEFQRTTFVFVCTGNTCRSPMAWGLARDWLARRFECRPEDLVDRKFDVLAAGTSAFPGSPPSEHSVAVMADRGIDISAHTADAVSIEMIHRADYVFTMTRSHRQVLLHMVPSAESYIRTLNEVGNIADPIGGARSDYESCAREIDEALESRFKEIEL